MGNLYVEDIGMGNLYVPSYLAVVGSEVPQRSEQLLFGQLSPVRDGRYQWVAHHAVQMLGSR